MQFFKTHNKHVAKAECLVDAVQLRCLRENLNAILALRYSVEKISYLNSLREDEQKRMTPTFSELVQAKRILDLTEIRSDYWTDY